MTENKRFILDDDVILDNNSIADDGGRNLYWVVEYVQRQKLVDLLNELAEEKEELKSFKKLVYRVLKKEYDLRMNEMNIFAEKEDWQGYRATQLEMGTVQRIAKRLGVDLE